MEGWWRLMQAKYFHRHSWQTSSDGEARLPLKTSFVWCNCKLTGCVKTLNPQLGKHVEQSQSSAVLFLKFDSVLDFQAKRVTALLFSFQKPCRSQLFFFFCQGFCSSKTDFSGATLMRPSHRFHGDSHKTVKFPVFQKSCGGGVLQLSQTRFQRACRCFQRWTFHFLVNSAGLWILFIKTHSFAVSKNANAKIGE